ncbi:hypothetical protein WA026_017596 [Henosepilachna vigintioctopunctata]|uniref:Uncharacterized protein n=1 Tax=Henosepilachna vigintioctopunctata TaxID=420089 RepID=A0AAW1UT19_9CUCU
MGESRRKGKKQRKADDLDDLKQELDIDYHKISPEELYQRFQTHPENVSRVFILNRTTTILFPISKKFVL